MRTGCRLVNAAPMRRRGARLARLSAPRFAILPRWWENRLRIVRPDATLCSTRRPAPSPRMAGNRPRSCVIRGLVRPSTTPSQPKTDALRFSAPRVATPATRAMGVPVLVPSRYT